MLLILSGQLLVVASVALFALSPDSLLGCQLRIWLLCLGFTVVVGSTLVKTWRLCKVLGNHRLRQVPKLKSLLLAVGGLTVFAAILLSIWSVVATPLVGHVPLSKSQVLRSCVSTVDSSSIATLVTATLFIYEGAYSWQHVLWLSRFGMSPRFLTIHV
ncbi:hypothetical protein BCR44DRAFT_1191028 [Catenaria anguillulae PL171]|uniref:G-protein coupled receptors family 3 profile domain-containing protein n=1 Tax=Catenaria anguillulae PL171 TaxID=765915 RepID=A0A1Y2HIJ5_9FUNG|nr:hypothetical protein BCR44DRAFT_1191028 [Catenaria anguillulae PL171]